MIESTRLKSLLYRNLVALVFVPLLMLMLVIMAIHGMDVRRGIDEQNRAVLATVKGEISDSLQRRLAQLLLIGDMMKSRDSDTGTLLRSAISRHNFFEAVCVLDESGRITKIGLPDKFESRRADFLGTDLSRQDFFRQVRANSGPVWSETALSIYSGNPTLNLALPAGNGMIVGSLDLNSLRSLCETASGNDVIAMIMTRHGQVIAHLDQNLVRQQANFANLDIVKQGMRGSNGSYRFTYLGREHIGVIATIPETGWMLVVSRDAGKAYAPIYRLFMIFVVGLALSALSVLWAASRNINRILAPIEALRESTRSIATGSFLEFKPLYSIHEIDELGADFRSMSVSIQAREAELHERNNELMALEEELRQQLEENFQFQDQLIMASERQEMFLASIGEGLMVTDEKGTVTFFNSFAEEIMGKKGAEAIGRNIWEVLSEAAGNVFHVKCQEALSTRRFVSFSALYEPVGLWLEVRCYPFVDGLTIFFRDVTAARKAEEQLNRSREFYLKMFEESPSLIWRANPDGDCDYVNRSWMMFTGRSFEESMGDGWIGAMHPDDRTECLAIRSDAFETRNQFSIEYRLAFNDGTYRWVVDFGRPFNGLDGNYAGFVGTCYDLTERKQLEERLLHASRLESVGTLAGGIAHDFNNILTVILGCSEMAQRMVEDHTPASRYIAQVIESANRAAGLTRNLLAFSRKQPMEVTVVDLNRIVSDLEKLLSRIIPEDISLTFTLCSNKLTIMADAGQIEQVLINMVANSRDAMSAGGNLRISTRHALEIVDNDTEDQNGASCAVPCAVLEVADDGIGMDSGTLQRIFDPFYTTKEVGKGTGLGLSMAYGIISQHRGKIEVSSEPGSGAVFTIFLPLTSEAAFNVALPGKDVRVQGNETILLVEDDPFVRDATKAILEFGGYRVLTADNGEIAVHRFAESRADLVLMDVIMPVMNGMEAYRKIRERVPDVCILFTSGYTSEILSREGIEPGDVRLLQKPVPPDTLLRAVRNALDEVR